MKETINYGLKKPDGTDTVNIDDLNSNADIIDEKLKDLYDTKSTKDVVTTTANGLMSSADKTKLNGIAAGANSYTHPGTHAATMITEDTSHRFVTDTEKSTWNGKASTNVATTTANGLMSSADKSKLDGVAVGANAYVHPSTHVATMITEDATHRFVTDTEKSTWNGKASTNVATTTTNGLMASADKVKLNGIAAGANAYTHPSTHAATMITEDTLHRFLTDVERTIINSWDNFKKSGGSIDGDIDLKTGINALRYSIKNTVGDTFSLQCINDDTLGIKFNNIILQTLNKNGDYYIGNYLKDNNGYTKMPNGYILQWGNYTTSFASGYSDVPVNFPIIFPTTCFAVIPNIWHIGGGDVTNVKGISANTISKTGFRCSIRYFDIGNWQFSVNWIAIGC